MRKRLTAILIPAFGLLLGASQIRADQKDDLFARGNAQYQAGQVAQALESYQAILAMGYENGPLYYNMGNCCYKMSRIGQAILYYERARKRMPSDEDLKTNLALANLSTMDRIEPQREFILVQAVRFAVRMIPRPVLTVLTALTYALSVALFILWLLSRKRFWRSAGLRGAVMSAAAFVLLGLLLAGRVQEDRSFREAVVLAAKVEVMSAPGEQGGVEVFSLHEGTKVRLDRESGQWMEIILPDRKVGWVKKDALGVI
jgi:tetratricopeptide (TPR) repeat protein